MKLKYRNDIYSVILKSEKNTLSADFENSEKVSLRKFSNSEYTFTDNDINKNVFRAEDKRFVYVYASGEYFKFEKLENEQNYDNTSNSNNDVELIYSPTPGSVIKILVSIDDLVNEGDPLVIIESMKMENTIYSSINGKVIKLETNIGEQISTDKLLIEIVK